MAEFLIEITNEAGAAEQEKITGGPTLKDSIERFHAARLRLTKHRIEGHAFMVSAIKPDESRAFRAGTGEFGRDLAATAAYVIAMAVTMLESKA